MDEEHPPSSTDIHQVRVADDRDLQHQRYTRHLRCALIAGRAVGNRFAPVILLRHSHGDVTRCLDSMLKSNDKWQDERQLLVQ